MGSCDQSSTCIREVHLDDIGTVFIITINECTNGVSTVLDISAASTMELSFKKPSGVVDIHSAVFVTDGTDGQISYTIQSGDLDEVGEWKIQARLVFAGGTWRSDVGSFRVYSNL